MQWSKSKPCCYKCGYSHPNGKCQAKGQQCYACAVAITTTLCCASKRDAGKTSSEEALSPTSTYPAMDIAPAAPTCRHCCRSHSLHAVIPGPHLHSPSCSTSHGTSPKCSSHSIRCSTPHRYFQDAIDVIPADSITTGNQAESKLFMVRASDSQVAFFTCLNLPARSGTKTMVVKIDPGTQVNTIPLSRYHTLFPNKLTKSRYPKAKSLMPTQHTWISHDGSPKPFLGHFIVEVAHAKSLGHTPLCSSLTGPSDPASRTTRSTGRTALITGPSSPTTDISKPADRTPSP